MMPHSPLGHFRLTVLYPASASTPPLLGTIMGQVEGGIAIRTSNAFSPAQRVACIGCGPRIMDRGHQTGNRLLPISVGFCVLCASTVSSPFLGYRLRAESEDPKERFMVKDSAQ